LALTNIRLAMQETESLAEAFSISNYRPDRWYKEHMRPVLRPLTPFLGPRSSSIDMFDSAAEEAAHPNLFVHCFIPLPLASPILSPAAVIRYPDGSRRPGDQCGSDKSVRRPHLSSCRYHGDCRVEVQGDMPMYLTSVTQWRT
jgi:hypothetical protein